jgi:hypothetical protein
MAGTTGLEPATSDVTGRRSNQLNYVPACLCRIKRWYHVSPDSAKFRCVCNRLPNRLGSTCEIPGIRFQVFVRELRIIHELAAPGEARWERRI